MGNIENSVIDFLTYSTFSFSLYSLQCKEANDILEKIIARAYRDAASHVANENTDRKGNGTKRISEAIKQLKDKQICYCAWHKTLCRKLEVDLSGTFGFSQKWVNMTMKYLVLVCDLWQGMQNKCESKFVNEYCTIVDNYRNCFHPPVDRFIINTVWKLSKEVSLPLKEGVSPEKRIKTDYKNPADYVKPWSQWSETDYDSFYMSFCKQIKNGEDALKWEGSAWIKAVEGRYLEDAVNESTP